MVMLKDWGSAHVLYADRVLGCSGWVHKQCSGVKASLVRAEDMFVCERCERAGDEEDRNVEESLDQGNGVHLNNIVKICYLGDV